MSTTPLLWGKAALFACGVDRLQEPHRRQRHIQLPHAQGAEDINDGIDDAGRGTGSSLPKNTGYPFPLDRAGGSTLPARLIAQKARFFE